MNPDSPGNLTWLPDPLPRLYVITDRASAKSGTGDVITTVEKSTRAGARFFQLRDKHANSADHLHTGRLIAEITDAPDRILLVNTHADIARSLNLHGVHRPGHGPSISKLRHQLGNQAIIGASTHSLAEALQAEQDGATFVTVSPVFLSASKPGYGPALNLDGLQLVASTLKIPVYALGGILPENTLDCLNAGAYGIAVMGGIMAAADPARATRRYLNAIETFDAISH